MATLYDLTKKLSPQAQKEVLAQLDAEAAADAADPLSGYTVAPSTYNVDTATQSPSMADDLATNAAYQHALRTEAYTGDPYPMIDLGNKRDPFSPAANEKQFYKDQAALDRMTGGQFGGDVIRYPTSAATNLNPSPDPVVVPGTEPEPTKEVEEVIEEVVKGGARRGRPGFDEPERMQAVGQRKMDRARAMLAEADSRQDKRRARSKLRAGHAMRKQGRIAGAFRDVGERRSERLQAGEEVGKQNKRLDKRFGAALKSFGSDVATEIADTYGAGRYGKARSEMTDEQRDKLISNLERRSELKAGAQEEAGGQGLKQITGTTPNAEKQRAAAIRAREYNKKINRQLGRASRRFGAEEVSQTPKAWVLQSTPVNRYV